MSVGQSNVGTTVPYRATVLLLYAQALWLMTAGESGGSATVAGLYGGKLIASARSITLRSYSDSRGVTVSGTIALKKFGPPLVFQGAVTVGGTAAAHGVVGLSGASLAGSLGGHSVH